MGDIQHFLTLSYSTIMVAGAVVENKKRKRSHADKRANKKKQEVSQGEAKAVEPVVEEEKAQVEEGLLLFNLDLILST